MSPRLLRNLTGNVLDSELMFRSHYTINPKTKIWKPVASSGQWGVKW